jgi:hypothetical protein
MSEVWYVDLIDPLRVISRVRTIARVKNPDDTALIAAAPELLAALEATLPALPNPSAKSGVFFELRQRAITAIAKAKGQ